MWKSIKKFFKWIADHTGISWIAKKISSGWNWLFSDKVKQQQGKPSVNKEQEVKMINQKTKSQGII